MARVLNEDAEVIMKHPLNCSLLLDAVDGVFIRNIWPTHEYMKEWNVLKERIRALKIPVYNPLTYRGDVEGKDYLIDLSKSGYPVIPSVSRVEDIDELPAGNGYWIKPRFSCDGFGARKLTREELLFEKPKGYVIQPFMTFESEPSFFFIDNEFHHSITAKHRLFDDRVLPYDASDDDLRFAKEFVQWSDMPFGLQRIDAIRLESGQLLLTEVENLCPYLFLIETDAALRDAFLARIKESVMRRFD